jgi:hypothetical protein
MLPSPPVGTGLGVKVFLPSPIFLIGINLSSPSGRGEFDSLRPKGEGPGIRDERSPAIPALQRMSPLYFFSRSSSLVVQTARKSALFQRQPAKTALVSIEGMSFLRVGLGSTGKGQITGGGGVSVGGTGSGGSGVSVGATGSGGSGVSVGDGGGGSLWVGGRVGDG